MRKDEGEVDVRLGAGSIFSACEREKQDKSLTLIESLPAPLQKRQAFPH
ncbi:MAG: hypothetical protein ACR2GR_02250 [Rhodothermales bacterium]